MARLTDRADVVRIVMQAMPQEPTPGRERPADEAGVTALTTHNLDEARSYVDSVFTANRLVTPGHPNVDFDLRFATSTRTTIGHLTYGARVMVDVPPPESCYHVTVPIQGACVVGQRGERAAIAAGRSAAMLSPTEPLTVQWEPDSVQYIFKITRASLETQLARLTGRAVERPIRCALEFGLDSGRGRALAASVAFLWSELARPGGICTIPLAREQLESAVLTQLLSVVPHEFSALLAEQVPASRRRIQRIVALIDEDPGRNLTTAELAATAGVSERALQLGFRKEMGISPTAYVRAVRLDRVHWQLREGVAETTITEVAARWGFVHPSRFAQQYRARFGLLPSETLARAR